MASDLNLLAITDINLASHKTWTIEGDRRGDVIRCSRGTLWITQQGDRKDYVIEAGQDFWVTQQGTVVVQALNDSVIKYSLNEMASLVENNTQPNNRSNHLRINHPLR